MRQNLLECDRSLGFDTCEAVQTYSVSLRSTPINRRSLGVFAVERRSYGANQGLSKRVALGSEH